MKPRARQAAVNRISRNAFMRLLSDDCFQTRPEQNKQQKRRKKQPSLENRYLQIWKFYERISMNKRNENALDFFSLLHSFSSELVQFDRMINYGYLSVTCSNLIMNIICSRFQMLTE